MPAILFVAVVFCGGNAEQRTEEGAYNASRSRDLVSVGETPYRRQADISGCKRGNHDKREPVENVIEFVRNLHVSCPFRLFKIFVLQCGMQRVKVTVPAEFVVIDRMFLFPLG